MARLNELLELQEYYTEKKNLELVGTIQTILTEGESLKKRQVYKTKKDRNHENVDSSSKDRNHENVDTSSELCDLSHLSQMMGRTESGKIVHFNAKDIQPGQMVDITIEHAYPHSLWGRVHGS